MGHLLKPLTAIDNVYTRPGGKINGHGKLPLRELTEQAILQQVGPAAALVNSQGVIFYLHGRTGMYLEPVHGEASSQNILKMAREGLKRDLVMALHKVSRTKEVVRCEGLRVKTNGDFTAVDLTVSPVTTGPSTARDISLYLVLLDKVSSGNYKPIDIAEKSTPKGEAAPDTDVDARIIALNQ